MRRAIIMGAAGRDMHNFNVFFRRNKKYKVFCFTAEQIPGISSRVYPRELAGKNYPRGIPIFKEEELEKLIKKYKIDDVFLSYSDLSHLDVMHKASTVLSNGANFVLLGSKETYIKSKKPVIAVTAVRTGCGKSQTSRKVIEYFRDKGKRVVVVRHPMPYGNLKKQIVQRFSKFSDLKKFDTTIEEQEEYEKHLSKGTILYAGVDYEKILKRAEKEADIIVWDGGNNDFSFYEPDIQITVLDALRPGHEVLYHPGEANLRMSDVLIINKVNSSKKENVNLIKENIKMYNPRAKLILADSVVSVDDPNLVKNKKVLVIGDGPTLTHGGMAYGAGTIAAKKYDCKIIDPRTYAVGDIKKVFNKFKHLRSELPAMGYGTKQIKELELTINKVKCDVVLNGTPANIKRIMKINKPIAEVGYEYKDKGELNKILSRI